MSLKGFYAFVLAERKANLGQPPVSSVERVRLLLHAFLCDYGFNITIKVVGWLSGY